MEKDEKIYIDNPTQYGHTFGSKFSHMTCTNREKLHDFAQSIGIKKCWFENKRGMNRPHYDVKESYFSLAVKKGAIHLSLRDYSSKCKELFGEMYPDKKQKTLL